MQLAALIHINEKSSKITEENGVKHEREIVFKDLFTELKSFPILSHQISEIHKNPRKGGKNCPLSLLATNTQNDW